MLPFGIGAIGKKAVAFSGYGPDCCTGGTASASSAQDPVANAFDDNTSTYWRGSGTGGADWIQYDFGAGNAKVIEEVTINIQSPWHTYNAPYVYYIKGSNDGTNWTQLAFIDSVSFSAGETKAHTFANSTAYRYIRLDITRSADGSSKSVVCEMTANEGVYS